jgi:hypothetical protein
LFRHSNDDDYQKLNVQGIQFMTIFNNLAKKTTVTASAVCMAALALPTVAHAATQIVCTAKISEVVIQPGGSVIVNFVGVGTPALCNINQNTPIDMQIANGATAITPDVCKALLSTLITAKATQANFTMVINYAGQAPASCASLPSFSNLVPVPFPYWFDLG